jgi:hypothetical protein
MSQFLDDLMNEVDIDVAERQAIQSVEGNAEATAPAYFQLASRFLTMTDPIARYLVNELIPERSLVLMHGEPRSRKSWAALDICIALATGTPAFGLDRFAVVEPRNVLYLSQEDSAQLVRSRTKALLAGRGVDICPSTLAFSVHAGINIEAPSWQDRLLRDIDRNRFQFVAFDPIRRFAINVDKGPAEVRAITGFLRRLVTETGTTVGVVHHDTKPPVSGPDMRRRAHRASGGDWFAAAECPIAFELAGETSTFVYPESYKTASDPAPFSFRLETDDPRNPVIARLLGETASAGEALSTATDETVLAFVTQNPGTTGRAICRALRRGADTVGQSLDRLFSEGKVDCADLGKGKGKRWTVC